MFRRSLSKIPCKNSFFQYTQFARLSTNSTTMKSNFWRRMNFTFAAAATLAGFSYYFYGKEYKKPLDPDYIENKDITVSKYFCRSFWEFTWDFEVRYLLGAFCIGNGIVLLSHKNNLVGFDESTGKKVLETTINMPNKDISDARNIWPVNKAFVVYYNNFRPQDYAVQVINLDGKVRSRILAYDEILDVNVANDTIIVRYPSTIRLYNLSGENIETYQSLARDNSRLEGVKNYNFLSSENYIIDIKQESGTITLIDREKKETAQIQLPHTNYFVESATISNDRLYFTTRLPNTNRYFLMTVDIKKRIVDEPLEKKYNHPIYAYNIMKENCLVDKNEIPTGDSLAVYKQNVFLIESGSLICVNLSEKSFKKINIDEKIDFLKLKDHYLILGTQKDVRILNIKSMNVASKIPHRYPCKAELVKQTLFTKSLYDPKLHEYKFSR